MAASEKLQTSRYELKYIIDEPMAEAIRRFTQAHLAPDQYTKGKEGRGYAVHSLYLDSRNLHTCRATQAGEKNRFKLRLRFYDDEPTSPVFFEIKGRENQVIKKQRAAVRRPRAYALLDGATPTPADLFKEKPGDMAALINFCQLRDRLQAVPAAFTSYMREGYEPPDDNNVRVTFDRELRAGKYRGQLSAADLESWPQPDLKGVVLELKFNDRFPQWMHTLVEWFQLRRTSVPKYVKCVTLVNRWPEEVPISGPMLDSLDDNNPMSAAS